jgi:outer membrane protein OmpA-like peptidoglycan-associated protein
MLRGKSARVLAAVVVVVLAGVVGVSLRAFRSPPRPEVIRGTGEAGIRDPNSTVYTAADGILFDVDSAELKPDAIPALRAIAADIKASGTTGIIRVEGYTDDVGSDDYNHALSGHRAGTVAQWLEDEAGFDGDQLKAIAYGELSPAQPNDSDAQRQANRRVVIAVVKISGPTPSAAAPSPAASG